MNGIRQRGFTLIEIILVVALIAIVAGVGLQLPHLFVSGSQQEADVFAVTTALYRARTLAAVNKADSSWGVSVAETGVTMFQGDSYGARDANLDEVTLFDSKPVIGGQTEIVFAHGIGLPMTIATVSLQYEQQTASISVNAYGVINTTVTQ